jgi:parallel beta-helix repeat protein
MGTKSKSLALVLILLFLTSLVALQTATVKANPKTIIVPDDYPTIQTAIDNASAGDRVFVKKGVYYTYTDYTHQLTINKPLSLIGENPETTFLDGAKESYLFIGTSPYHPYGFFSGINITASDVTLSGFTIRNCGTAITLFDDEKSHKPISKVEIIGNNIINNSGSGDNYYSNGDSIRHYGYEANNIIISGNNITGNTGTGIDITGESFFIMGNNISNNRYGITLEASNSVISYNNVFGNDYNGVRVSSCKNVTIEQNIINDNGVMNFNTTADWGGYLKDSGGLSLNVGGPFYVYNNNINGNHKFGVQLQAINNSTIESNTVMDNGAGIRVRNYIYGGRFFSIHEIQSGNTICNNNLIGNLPNVIIESAYPYFIDKDVIGNGTDVISWDNGKVGNYWSDYSGNGSYVIDQNNVDHHPLTQQVDISVPAPTPTSTQPNEILILPIAVTFVILAVVVAVLLFRLHRKPISQNKPNV